MAFSWAAWAISDAFLGAGALGLLVGDGDLLDPLGQRDGLVALHGGALQFLLAGDGGGLHGLLLADAGDLDGLLARDLGGLHGLLLFDLGGLDGALLGDDGLLGLLLAGGLDLGDLRPLVRLGLRLLALQLQYLLARLHVAGLAGLLGGALQVVALHHRRRRDLGDLALALGVEHVVVGQFRRVGLVQLARW